MKSFVFVIPENDVEAMVKLVSSVPDDWARVKGALDAPPGMVSRGSKMPSSVDFGNSDLEGKTLEELKNVIAAFLQEGYRGHLIFSSGDGRKSPSPERCEMHLKLWRGFPPDETNVQDNQPLVQVLWHERLGGKRERAESIIQACLALGLREYELTSAAK